MEKEFNSDKAYAYLNKKGLDASKAVMVNGYLSQRCDKFLKNSLKITVDGNGNEYNPCYALTNRYRRERNIYAWLMIKTSIDEYKQGWRYIEDMDKYFDYALSSDVDLDYKVQMNIDMCKYFRWIFHEVVNDNMVAPFEYICWQYTLVRFQEQGMDLERYFKWKKSHPQKVTHSSPKIN